MVAYKKDANLVLDKASKLMFNWSFTKITSP